MLSPKKAAGLIRGKTEGCGGEAQASRLEGRLDSPDENWSEAHQDGAPEHSKYLGVPQSGSFKAETYRY
jgi:hypothetical protein